jgi:hypothetical protein
MTSTLLVVFAVAVAVAGAVRSTWSPCGVSMLATVTPLAEAGRGHRYRSTARWFVAGAVGGGTTLGLALAALALAARAAGPSPTVVAALACGAGVLAAASDRHVGGFALPVHHRQVNERWLDQFRSWVYGAGFGWQIGTGFATYIKTTAVYLLVVLAALTASPWLALALGVLFGLVRGLAVLLGRRITTPAALAEFHRRFTALGPVALGAVVTVEAAGALAFALLLSPWLALALFLAGVSVALQPRMSTALTRAGTMRTTTRVSPGASYARRSASYPAPTRSAKARSSSGSTSAVPPISR